MAGKRKKMHPDTNVHVPDIPELKKSFIGFLKKGGIITWSAAQIGRDRKTIDRWRKEDPLFDEECLNAVDHSTEILRESIYLRAMDRTDRFSAVLAMFEMKRRDPAYRDRLDVHGRVVHGGIVGQASIKADPELREMLKGMTKQALQSIAEKL